jgi:ADP-ribosylglycohydrolase
MKDDVLADLARQDASLTHAHPICQDSNAVFCVAIAAAIRENSRREDVYRHTMDWARSSQIHPQVLETIEMASKEIPTDFMRHQGWVLLALQNAFFQLIHAQSFEDGIVSTIAQGGDTDTNAAIAGALLGAAFGSEAIPVQWVNSLLTCRPMHSVKGYLNLAQSLLACGLSHFG